MGTPNSFISPQQINPMQQPVIIGSIQGGTGGYVNPNFQATISNVALTSNVATITTGTNGFLPGQYISAIAVSVATALVTGVGQIPWGPITPTSTTVFTFVAQNANIGTAANTGTITVWQTLVTAGPSGSLVSGVNAYNQDSGNAYVVGLCVTNAAYPPGNNYTSTATAAGSTSLTVNSYFCNIFTGSTTQTVVLPVTSTLPPPPSTPNPTSPTSTTAYQVINWSTGVVTVQSSGANTLLAMAANTVAIFTYNGTAGTGIASWTITYYAPVGIWPLINTNVPLSSGVTGTVVAINVLNSTQVPGLRLDAYGDPCYELPPGFSLLTNTTAVVTAAKSVLVAAITAENY